MLWHKRKAKAPMVIGTRDFADNSQLISVNSSVDGKKYSRWWPMSGLPVRWISAPNRAAKRALLRIPAAFHINFGDGNNVSAVYASAKLLKRLYETLPVGYFTGNNFSELVVLLLEGGLIIVVNVLPPSLRSTLHVDYLAETCSTYVAPFVYATDIWIKENGSELVSILKEVWPVLKACSNRTVFLMKILYAKAEPVLLAYVTELVPLLQRILYSARTKELIIDRMYDLQKCWRYLVYDGGTLIPPEYVNFIIENRLIVFKCFLRVTVTVFTSMVQAIPQVVRFLRVITSMTYNTGEDLIQFIHAYLERNPEIYQGIKTTWRTLQHQIAIILHETNPVLYKCFENFLSVTWKLLQILFPVALALVKAHHVVVLELLKDTVAVLLPLVNLALRKSFSPEARLLLANSLPVLISTATKIFTLFKGFCKCSSFLCCKTLEVEPTIVHVLKDASICYCKVTSAVSLGLCSAFIEILPAVLRAIEENLPLLKSGGGVVISDVWNAATVVGPDLCLGLREVLCSLSAAYFEVYPDLIAAGIAAYPEVLQAVSTVTPVLLNAYKELLYAWFQASCVVIPDICRAVYVVTPTLWRAAKLSTPVIFCASQDVYCTSQVALREVLSTFHYAFSEVISASVNGACVVSGDLIYAYYTIFRNSKLALENGPSRDEVGFIISTAIQEVSSLMWIIFCWEVTDAKALSQAHFQIEMSKTNEIMSSMCRQSRRILALTLKTALFWKVCLSKSNSVASSTICEVNIRVSQCYERVEPLVLEMALKSRTYLKAVLSRDKAIVIQESPGSLETFYSWFRSHDVFGKVLVRFPKISFSLQGATREVCLIFFYSLFKTVNSIRNVCIATSPLFWRCIRRVAPELWHLVRTISPPVWSAVCKTSRELWHSMRLACPRLWKTYCSMCASAWDVSCLFVPEAWNLVKILSPHVWSLLCDTCSTVWDCHCQNCAATWNAVCVISPNVWQHVCASSVASWAAYCHLVSKSWDIFRFSVESSWKVQRFSASIMWYSLIANNAALDSFLRESRPALRMLFKLSENAWFCFCAATVFCVIMYQCESVTDLFFGSTLSDAELLESEKVLLPYHTNNEDVKPSVPLPKASEALLVILNDIASVKSFFSSTKSLVAHYLRSSPTEIARDAKMKFSENYSAASRRILDNRFCRAYVSLRTKSRIAISSLRLPTDYLPLF